MLSCFRLGIGDWDSVVGAATGNGLISPGFELRRGGVFRTHPQTPLSFLYSGHRMYFPGVKRSGRDADHQPLSSAVVGYDWRFSFTLICTCLASLSGQGI
jgi:hypothetical protein